jgi:hypothetical protein
MLPHPAVGWNGDSWTFCPCWSGIGILLISAFQVTRIVGMSHWHPAWFFVFFLLKKLTWVCWAPRILCFMCVAELIFVWKI